MQADGASLYLLLCPGFVPASREGAELRGLECPSRLWLQVGVACALCQKHDIWCVGGGKVLMWHLCRQWEFLPAASTVVLMPGMAMHTLHGMGAAGAAALWPLSLPEPPEVLRDHEHKMAVWPPSAGFPAM